MPATVFDGGGPVISQMRLNAIQRPGGALIGGPSTVLPIGISLVSCAFGVRTCGLIQASLWRVATCRCLRGRRRAAPRGRRESLPNSLRERAVSSGGIASGTVVRRGRGLRAKPAAVSGDPRSLMKTKGDGGISRWSRRGAPDRVGVDVPFSTRRTCSALEVRPSEGHRPRPHFDLRFRTLAAGIGAAAATGCGWT
jgi:hypothetical protein